MVISSEACKVIRSFWDDSSVFDETNSKYASVDGKKVKLKTNKVKANYVNVTSKTQLDYILNLIRPLGIKSISLKEASIMRYKVGDYFGPHRDFPDYGYDRLNRTVIIQLSDPSEYDGGDLIVKGVNQPRDLGSVISVGVNDFHEVTEILRGERLTIAIFLLNRDIEITKTAL